MEISLVFPHQLYENNPCLQKHIKVVMVEAHLFFKQYAFHQQKIVFHRASMQFYRSFLSERGFDLQYIESTSPYAVISPLVAYLHEQGVRCIAVVELVDDWLQNQLKKACADFGIVLKVYKSPNFLCSLEETNVFFEKKRNYSQTDFYIWQRKRYQILLDTAAKPVGGKWTYDAENRSKFPKTEKIPHYNFPTINAYVKEAKSYVRQYFGKHYGSCERLFGNENQFYPTTFDEAKQWLQDFVEQRFSLFGIYEDALVAKQNILYHSVLTPMLNVGLLSPQQIVEAALEHAASHSVPLNSLEGFIRQVIGWREFIRLVYEREGRRQRSSNYWNFTRKIPRSFYNGSTGILPVDNCIKKVLENGYNHHIERLMVLGNFMLLCEFDPNEVYKWFMEMYVDAYDWVMVPNVYGMTQFADGGLMTTKPYISGSNYLMKMGDFEKGAWQEVWDGLFWYFMDKQRVFFLQNPRLGMLVGTLDKMDRDKRNGHFKKAQSFLSSLDAN
ncbi:MAG: cryptochrome/photolyase family protein [Cytophagales bacterium]|nr:MAG: cryptochrome/photolyase family protein [Cytophagales bacterium]TAF62261.1 MAG: cryptochrome/photolyase family protein [Cytophagales bacterium]